MLIDCKGIRTDKYHIPPFTLNKGELVVLYLYDGMHFYDLAMWLKDIFTGKVEHDNVIIYNPLSFVEHFKEPALRRMFHPITVKEFVKKNIGETNEYSKKIYQIAGTTGKTKVKMLMGGPKKLLGLYATLSKTNNIVFNLKGVNAIGAKDVYTAIRENMAKGHAAILLDYCNDLKHDCTKYIEMELL
jgi:hypothetical protein